MHTKENDFEDCCICLSYSTSCTYKIPETCSCRFPCCNDCYAKLSRCVYCKTNFNIRVNKSTLDIINECVDDLKEVTNNYSELMESSFVDFIDESVLYGLFVLFILAPLGIIVIMIKSILLLLIVVPYFSYRAIKRLNETIDLLL